MHHVVPTCMRSHVGLEVRALGVGLATARELAAVRGGALPGPGPAPSLGLDASLLLRCVKLQQGRRWRRQHQTLLLPLPLHGHVPLVHIILPVVMILVGVSALMVDILRRARRVMLEVTA